MCLPILDLSHRDKEILLHVSPTAWITYSIVNAAQQLLREQFPQLPSLQDVSLGLTMAFNSMPSKFLQILHVSRSHPTVKIYDSLFHSLPSLAKAKIASLLCNKEDIIEAHIVDVKLQVCILI